jgi:hypothetical protein
LDQQIASLRDELREVEGALTKAIEPVRDLAAKILKQLSHDNPQAPTSDQPTTEDLHQPRIAVTLLLVVFAMTGIGIADSKPQSVMGLLIAWLVALYTLT